MAKGDGFKKRGENKVFGKVYRGGGEKIMTFQVSSKFRSVEIEGRKRRNDNLIQFGIFMFPYELTSSAQARRLRWNDNCDELVSPAIATFMGEERSLTILLLSIYQFSTGKF